MNDHVEMMNPLASDLVKRLCKLIAEQGDFPVLYEDGEGYLNMTVLPTLRVLTEEEAKDVELTEGEKVFSL